MASEWQLGISYDNCCVMTLEKMLSFTIIVFVVLPTVSLPVILACSFQMTSPSAHISDIVFRAHQRANLIFRCFVSYNIIPVCLYVLS